MSIGAFTALEVMLTMRPKPRSIMPSTVALISSIGVSMLASSALIQASRSQSRKSPGGGPPALVTRMSKSAAGRRERRRAALGGGDVGGHRQHLRRPAARARPAAARPRAAAPRRRAPRSPRSRPRAPAPARSPCPAPCWRRTPAPTCLRCPDPCDASCHQMKRIIKTRRLSGRTAREDEDAGHHQHGAGHDPDGERLAQDQHAHQDGRHRPDHAGLRRQRRRRCARSPSSPSAPARRCTAWR